VEGELVYLGSLPEDGSPPEDVFSADLKGKIALVDAPLPPMLSRVGFWERRQRDSSS